MYKNDLLVVDSRNNRIVNYTIADQSWPVFAGSGKKESVDGDLKTASFDVPQSIYVYNDTSIFVGENFSGASRVLK